MKKIKSIKELSNEEFLLAIKNFKPEYNHEEAMEEFKKIALKMKEEKRG